MRSITCPVCRKTSWNQNDVREGYCGRCHAFTTDYMNEPKCYLLFLTRSEHMALVSALGTAMAREPDLKFVNCSVNPPQEVTISELWHRVMLLDPDIKLTDLTLFHAVGGENFFKWHVDAMNQLLAAGFMMAERDKRIEQLKKTLHDLITLLQNEDADERERAVQEGRSAHVHTDVISKALAQLLNEPRPPQ